MHIDAGLAYYDIGCGSGAFLRELAKHKQPTALGGVEVSERFVQNAAGVLRSTNVPVSLAVYEGLNVPADIERYDYLMLIDVLHHLPRDRQFGFLERLFQRMKPGQRLLLKDIDADSPLVFWNKLHDLLVSREIGHERSADFVKGELEHIGFQVQLLFKNARPSVPALRAFGVTNRTVSKVRAWLARLRCAPERGHAASY